MVILEINLGLMSVSAYGKLELLKILFVIFSLN